ncbi:hypothetical protein KCF3NO3_34520 [Chryseobacterium sp. KCF3-3]
MAGWKRLRSLLGIKTTLYIREENPPKLAAVFSFLIIGDKASLGGSLSDQYHDFYKIGETLKPEFN